MLRFGKAFQVRRFFNGTTEKEFLIPPISAFVALENAVKHNEISEQKPLQLELRIDKNLLVIQNNLQPKRSIQHSSHIGLKNLDERFKIITGKGIDITKEKDHFRITLPLTPI